MAVFLSPIGNGAQYFTTGGAPLNGGFLNTYQAGTTTPQATFTTSAGNVANPVSIPLGTDGRPPAEIWLTDGIAYKFILTDSLGAQVGPPMDNISGIGSGGTTSTSLASSSGASLIGWIQAGVGAVLRLVQDKLRESVSLKDYGAVGDGVTDDTAAIQAALNSGLKKIKVTGGTYLHTLLTLPTGVSLVGAGGVLKMVAGQRFGIALANPSVNSRIRNVTFDASGMGGNVGVREERSVITTPPGVSGGTLTGLVIDGCKFLDMPAWVPASGSTGQVGHAIQLNYGEAIVTNNYTNQGGGDCYNFNAGYFIVTNNIAKNIGDGGIAFNNDARGVIANNFLYKCNLGIGAGPEGTTAAPDNTLLISNNEIVACDYGVNMGWFAFAGKEGPRNVKIIGNTIGHCKSRGIYYVGQAAGWDAYASIIGNSIYSTGDTSYDGTAGIGVGIEIGKCQHSIISHNILHDNVGTDIVVGQQSFVDVVLNDIDEAQDLLNAIDYSADSGKVQGNRVIGRRILIQNTTGCDVLDNICTVTSVAANQGGIVLATTAAGVKIGRNTLLGCGNGIYLQSLSQWFATVISENNTFPGTTNRIVNSPTTTVDGNNYVEAHFIGTSDGTGVFDIVHGLSSSVPSRLACAMAFKKGGSGEAIPLALSFVDGTRARWTGAGATVVCAGWIRVDKNSAATW